MWGDMFIEENEIVYWEHWLRKEEDIPITKDGYMFKYYIANEYGSCGVCNWLCCIPKNKLFTFIKYCILPSIQLTRTFGLNEGTVYLDVMDYDQTLYFLSKEEVDDSERYIDTYKRWFDEIDKLQANDRSFKDIREYLRKTTLEVDYKEGIYVDLDAFENINSVGKTLIEDFEKDGYLDILELELEMNKEQILDMFNNIDENQFMIKKIKDLLLDRLG